MISVVVRVVSGLWRSGQVNFEFPIKSTIPHLLPLTRSSPPTGHDAVVPPPPLPLPAIASSLPPSWTKEAEQRGREIIVGFLSDPNINPYKGSVPVERIQNIFRGKHADLYEAVVGNKHSAWRRYIERNSDILRDFPIEDGKWRMRLLAHVEWQRGDQQEEAARNAWDTHLTQTLTVYLESQHGRTSTLDAFMSAYPGLPQYRFNQEGPKTYTSLPHRGDLVRFIRRSWKFSYEQQSFLIGFRDEEQGDENEEDDQHEEYGGGKQEHREQREPFNTPVIVGTTGLPNTLANMPADLSIATAGLSNLVPLSSMEQRMEHMEQHMRFTQQQHHQPPQTPFPQFNNMLNNSFGATPMLGASFPQQALLNNNFNQPPNILNAFAAAAAAAGQPIPTNGLTSQPLANNSFHPPPVSNSSFGSPPIPPNTFPPSMPTNFPSQPLSNSSFGQPSNSPFAQFLPNAPFPTQPGPNSPFPTQTTPDNTFPAQNIPKPPFSPQPGPRSTFLPAQPPPANPVPKEPATEKKPQHHGINPEAEAKAKQIIVDYLSDPNINPYRASVPVEKIQNILRGRHSELYEQAVGSKHSAWRRYIDRNSDAFVQFSVEEGKWRMRLLSHIDWEAGDKQEEAAREAWENHLTQTLSKYLESLPERLSTLDAFMSRYPSMPQYKDDKKRVYPLPHRGDLVRFIRQCSKFTYDQSSFLICFKEEAKERLKNFKEKKQEKEIIPDKEKEKEKEKEKGNKSAKEKKNKGPSTLAATPQPALGSNLTYAAGEKEKLKAVVEDKKETKATHGLNPFAPSFKPSFAAPKKDGLPSVSANPQSAVSAWQKMAESQNGVSID